VSVLHGGRGPRSRVGLPTTGALRLVRGVVVGLVATALAGLGHALAGGRLPNTLPLLAIAAAAVLVALALSGQRWRLASLLTLLGLVQVAFHVAFHTAVHAGTTAHTMPDMSAGPTRSLPMPLLHVAAAVLTALALRRGEDWCWRLVDLLRRPLTATGSGRLPLPRLTLPVRSPRSVRPARILLSSTVRRRGPPGAALV